MHGAMPCVSGLLTHCVTSKVTLHLRFVCATQKKNTYAMRKSPHLRFCVSTSFMQPAPGFSVSLNGTRSTGTIYVGKRGYKELSDCLGDL